MIILLNAESILYEVMSAASLRIAHTLDLHPDWVKVTLKHGEGDDVGKLYPHVAFAVPEGTPAEGKFFTETRERCTELVGQVMSKAIRSYVERCEGAGV